MPPIRKHHQVTFNNHRVFDPWNSSSTGHQRGETSAGTAWRRTREEKLALQFSSSSSGDRERGDGRGCGYGDDDDDGEWVWMNDHPSLGNGNGHGHGNGNESVKESSQKDIRDMFSVGKGSSSSSSSSFFSGGDNKVSCLSSSSSDITTTTKQNQDQPKISPQIQETTKKDQDQDQYQNQKQTPPKIFANLTIHLNAASSPLISDHALRHLLVAHGASLSLGVSRRVTHIIVGRPNTSSSSSSTTGRDESKRSISGAGGGLSASKLQKEIAKAGCRGFRIVGVEWFVLFLLFFFSQREKSLLEREYLWVQSIC